MAPASNVYLEPTRMREADGTRGIRPAEFIVATGSNTQGFTHNWLSENQTVIKFGNNTRKTSDYSKYG